MVHCISRQMLAGGIRCTSKSKDRNLTHDSSHIFYQCFRAAKEEFTLILLPFSLSLNDSPPLLASGLQCLNAIWSFAHLDFSHPLRSQEPTSASYHCYMIFHLLSSTKPFKWQMRSHGGGGRVLCDVKIN